MTRPTVYLFRMAVFLAAVCALGAFLFPILWPIFDNNPGLNGLILGVLLFGVVWNLLQVFRLTTEVAWLTTYQNARDRLVTVTSPRLLAPMAHMLAGREGNGGQRRMTLSPTSMRSMLDGISSRLDEGRELSRYMTGLLIFLGLLGTFWGLLKTITAVSDVIGSMSAGAGDMNLLFAQLKTSLVRPLAGMGTAFSASLFGLSGALVLGFLDLTAGQAQNRFFNELEEWLARLTRLASGALADGEGSVPVYVQALLEQTAENMEGLQRVLTRGEDSRARDQQGILALTERLGLLTESMRANQQLMIRVAETQAALGPALQRLAEIQDGDEIARGHLRAIETALNRLLTESQQGRTAVTAELRGDLRLLTRTVAALAEPQRQA